MLCEEMEVRLQHKITFITPSSVRMWLYPVITQVSAGRYSRKNVKPPRVHFSVDPRCLSHFVWGSLLREWLTVKLAAAAALSHSSKLFFLPTHTLTLFQDSVKHNRHKLTHTQTHTELTWAEVWAGSLWNSWYPSVFAAAAVGTVAAPRGHKLANCSTPMSSAAVTLLDLDCIDS